MDKENRKKAQEQRRLEREKAARKKQLQQMLKLAVPLVVIIVIAAVIIAAVMNDSGSSNTDTSTAAEETTDTSTDSSEDTSDDAEEATSDDSDSEEETALNYSTDSSLTVEDGDTVNIDYVGSIDGVEFDGGSTGGAGTDLTIGSGSYIDDFEDQLIGAHPGDEVDVTVTFPENYGVDDLNGKEALFEVTVNGIYNK